MYGSCDGPRSKQFLIDHPNWREQLDDDVEGTVFLWTNDAQQINRVWRMYQLSRCFKLGKEVDFSCPSGTLSIKTTFPGGDDDVDNVDNLDNVDNVDNPDNVDNVDDDIHNVDNADNVDNVDNGDDVSNI